jgi:hypothetical protein
LALAARLRWQLPEAALRYLLGSQPALEGCESQPATFWESALAAVRALTILDPACGEGDFLLGALSVLESLQAFMATCLRRPYDVQTARKRIGAEQLFGIEVQDATLAVARERLRTATGAEPPLVHGDALLPAAYRSFEAIRQVDFDIVLGNPPYLRHERIADPQGRLSPDDYKRAITGTFSQRRPSRFALAGGGVEWPLNGRCDLCALFLVHGLSLLRPEGALAFVLPLALFQARYGAGVIRQLVDNGRGAILVESATNRSFAGAEVNTGVLLAAPGLTTGTGHRLRRLEIEGRPGGAHAAAVWDRCLRARPARRRVGDIRTVCLGDLGRLRYPIKTGVNRFFYPDEETIEHFAIEPRYLVPVLKSPRDVCCVGLDPESLRSLAFVCRDDPDELGPGAAQYIEWGSRQVNAQGVPWPEVATLRRKRPWYRLQLPDPADVLCPRFFQRRLFLAIPRSAVLEDQTLYGLRLAPESIPLREIISAMLTCSLTSLALETHGRSGLGDGVRQFALSDMAALPVPDPRAIAYGDEGPVVEAFRAVAVRPILSSDEEMRQPDRHVLDAAVGDALRLPAARLEAVRQEVVARVEQRIKRARSLRAAS